MPPRPRVLLVDDEPSERRHEEGPKAAAVLVGVVDEVPLEDDLREERLGQILRVGRAMTAPPEERVHRAPVLRQKLSQVRRVVSGATDERPARGLESDGRLSGIHACPALPT